MGATHNTRVYKAMTGINGFDQKMIISGWSC